MAQTPESVYLLGCIYDADTPGPDYWSFELADCIINFSTFARTHPNGAAWIEEIHPTKGALRILDYSPGIGLIRAEGYQTHANRWELKGYPQLAIEQVLTQFPHKPVIELAYKQASAGLPAYATIVGTSNRLHGPDVPPTLQETFGCDSSSCTNCKPSLSYRVELNRGH